jgi:glucose/arabinose dehydrogenase
MGHHRVATGFRRSVIAGLSVMLLGLGPASMAAPMDPASTDAATTTAPPSQTAALEETTAPATETSPTTETTAPATETSPTTETTAPATETTAPARRGPTDAADPLTLSGEGSADTSDVFGTAEVSTLAAGLPTGFTEETAFSGLNLPTMVRFSPDGRVFVVEKRGMVLAFDSLSDPTPKTVINLTGLTYGWADRGMHGMVLDPSFPTQPYMYLLYASDPLGWGDTCPNPPGGTIDGCVANARLTRIQVSGTNDVVGGEQVLLSGFWCQQYPSHSIGQLEFGSDGALYVSAGDGASFTFADYGQGGGSSGSPTPENPCGDPPVPVGGDQQPPTAEGGALRSQDLRTAGDPVSFDGAILRIDKATGAAFPGNPLIGGDPGDDRIIAIGQRNPFRITIRPGTNEVWSADVGWNHWEEINRIANPTTALTNFGWPCYEGNQPNASYDNANLNICENLYTASGAHTLPYFTYRHGLPVDGCDGQASSVSALVFYEGGNYPAEYDNALFFADYTRQCVWVMFPGANGLPSINNIQLFATASPTVGMEIGPGGDLFTIDHSGGRIIRFRHSGGGTNTPPTAVAAAAPTSGVAPLVVNFDGSGSSDPDSDPLTFAWDLDGDGQFDDSNAVNPSFTYSTANTYVAALRVDDGNGGVDTDTVTITVTTSGGGGGDGSVDLPGVAGNYISAPDNARLDLTGDADFRADVSFDDWQTNNGKLISKMGGAYEFLLDKTTGGLRVAWRDSANVLRIRNSTAALPIADGQRLQVRGTLDVDNGSGGHTVTFYYRTNTTLSVTDHTGWTQLGNPLTFTGTTNIRTGNSTVTLGSGIGGTADFWAGNYYQAAIFNGIAGTNVANPDFRTTTQLTSTPPDYSQWQDTPTNPWTINGTNWTYIPG